MWRIAMGFGRIVRLPAMGLALSLVIPAVMLVATVPEAARAQQQDQHGFTVLQSAELAAMLQKKDFFLVKCPHTL
jgi:hypothetical protein